MLGKIQNLNCRYSKTKRKPFSLFYVLKLLQKEYQIIMNWEVKEKKKMQFILFRFPYLK